MKKLSLFLIAISVSALLQAQKQLTEGVQAVQFTVTKMFDALSTRDSVKLKDYCTSDILLFENGQIWNADTLILKAITQNQATDFKRINTFDFINTTINKNIAWATYHLRSEITRNGKQGSVQWMETVVLVKEKKRWKIKLLHSTLIKRN